MEKGNSLIETKKKNRAMIKNEILRHHYATRVEIAHKLGITLPTVTTSVNQMIKDKIVMEIPIPEDHLKNTKGRTPAAITFNPEAASFVGVEMAVKETRIVLINLGRQIVAEEKKPPISGPYSEAIDRLCEMINTFIRDAHCNNVRGIGIGLPGIVDAENGIIRQNIYQSWNGKHISGDLYERLGISVRIDNNGHMRAIRYEMENGLSEEHPFAYYYASTGIICPMAIHYDDMNGYMYTEGEIGQTILETGTDRPVYLNDYGFGFFLQEGRKIIEGASVPDREEDLQDERSMLRRILEEQREGNEALDELFHSALDRWAVGLLNMTAFNNPKTIVTESRILDNPANMDYLKDRFDHYYRKGSYQDPIRFVQEPYDSFNAAKGAALCVIKRKYILE